MFTEEHRGGRTYSRYYSLNTEISSRPMAVTYDRLLYWDTCPSDRDGSCETHQFAKLKTPFFSYHRRFSIYREHAWDRKYSILVIIDEKRCRIQGSKQHLSKYLRYSPLHIPAFNFYLSQNDQSQDTRPAFQVKEKEHFFSDHPTHLSASLTATRNQALWFHQTIAQWGNDPMRQWTNEIPRGYFGRWPAPPSYVLQLAIAELNGLCRTQSLIPTNHESDAYC